VTTDKHRLTDHAITAMRPNNNNVSKVLWQKAERNSEPAFGRGGGVQTENIPDVCNSMWSAASVFKDLVF